MCRAVSFAAVLRIQSRSARSLSGADRNLGSQTPRHIACTRRDLCSNSQRFIYREMFICNTGYKETTWSESPCVWWLNGTKRSMKGQKRNETTLRVWLGSINFALIHTSQRTRVPLTVFCGNAIVIIVLTLVGVGAYFCVIIKHTSDQWINKGNKRYQPHWTEWLYNLSY